MRVLVIHAHPVETSYNAALHAAVVSSLTKAGHAVDDLSLYAERFDPVLTREERIGYHDLAHNRAGVAPYVDRLLAAEAIVFVYPVWNYGLPAILKGFVDRVFLPGVSFVMKDGKVVPTLTHIRKLAVVTTYGGTRFRAILAGDPPRKIAERVFRVTMGFPRLTYLAHYDMNRSTDATRSAFLAKVTHAMAAF
ncbi:NAD(P)H-dependent oxidoreductase [Mongoliimonas terrestris]|uniref:NAD(P)H-dependent oxidoreductase n=1 Tax=Mongoliimonas terrestris TaxID=1709001 RepID=UPI0009497701|nr:NAD(P)H-dependent oxidoreductase [Mongoliimonas terrestris]